MSAEREELIKRNQQFVSLPSPNLEKMTNEQLRKRAEMFEAMFEDLFEKDDTDERNE